MLTLPFLLAAPALADDPLTDIWRHELERRPAAGLVVHTTHADPAIRSRAALAMGRTHDEGALEPLSLLLADMDAEVRATAAFALGLTEGGDAPIRIALTHEEEPQVREQLYFALGLQPSADSIPVLVDGLERTPAEARGAAVALGKLARAELEGIEDAVVIEALAAQLARLDPDARRAAAFALGRMSPDQLPVAVRDDLKARADTDRDPTVRAYLVRALVPTSDASLLAAAADDVDVGVRVAAARGLAKIEATEVATSLLADGNTHVRVAALQALGGAEWTGAADLARPSLESEDITVRAAAVSSLAAVGETEHLRESLKPDQPLDIQVAATGALDDVNQLTRLAIRGESARIRTAAAGRLMEVSANATTGAALLASSDSAVVGVGLGLLAEDPDTSHLPAVLEVLAPATDPDVQREGMKALLALLPDVRDVPGSANAIVARGQASPSASIRAAAVPVAELLGLPAVEPWAMDLPDLAEVQEIRMARILTDQGELRVLLRPDVAPYTVHNFAKLAEDDFFDGGAFHRVVPDFVVQDGCPRGDGWGGPAWSIPDELSPLSYDEGVLGMALSGPDTGGSQWFLTLSPQPHLDAVYTVFGELTLGSGTMQSIQQGALIEDIVIERVPVR